MATKKETPGFEEAFEALEGIVGRLESGEMKLDEAMTAFEEGMGLVKLCTEKLDAAEARLKKLIQTDDGIRLEPMD